MKTVFVGLVVAIILIILFTDGCCSIKEITDTTYSDSTLTPGSINAGIILSDEEQINQRFQELYDIISMQRDELDSLRGLQYYNDTVFVPKYLPSKPRSSDFRWTASKITEQGDSVWVEHLIKGIKSIFNIEAYPKKIDIKVPHTTITQEYQEPWYSKLWSDFKDFILGGIIFLLLIILVVNKVRG